MEFVKGRINWLTCDKLTAILKDNLKPDVKNTRVTIETGMLLSNSVLYMDCDVCVCVCGCMLV